MSLCAGGGLKRTLFQLVPARGVGQLNGGKHKTHSAGSRSAQFSCSSSISMRSSKTTNGQRLNKCATWRESTASTPRASQPVEGLLVDGRVHVVELLHVMRAADEQADGAVARLRLPVRVTPGLLIGRVGLKPALEASSVGVFSQELRGFEGGGCVTCSPRCR
jgi:hypothetical protein